MGVNIYAERYIYGVYLGKIENWNSMRHSGDDDLMQADFKWYYLDNNSYEFVCRPIDLDFAIQWVKSNVYEGNQKRLIDLFELMKTDTQVYLNFSI
jgi:hypothetical protein